MWEVSSPLLEGEKMKAQFQILCRSLESEQMPWLGYDETQSLQVQSLGLFYVITVKAPMGGVKNNLLHSASRTCIWISWLAHCTCLRGSASSIPVMNLHVSPTKGSGEQGTQSKRQMQILTLELSFPALSLPCKVVKRPQVSFPLCWPSGVTVESFLLCHKYLSSA